MSKKRTPKLLAGYTHHNKVRLVHGGRDYFTTLIGLIDQAQSTIHIQTYIYEEDETGRQVSDALLRAAARKVEIYILLDGYASQDLSKAFIKTWKDAGIHFRWFWPLFKSRHFYLGRRLHHKVVAVDGAWSLSGGVNISDRYNDIGGTQAWLDRALLVEGEVALRLHIICRDMWTKAYWKTGPEKTEKSQWLPGLTPAEECLIRVRRNDWVMAKNQISRSFIEMFRQARSHITILSSYFLPGTIFRREMALAAKRGVRIRIIVGSVSDVKISRAAEQYMYAWLFRNGIEIYEYQETVLHGKMATYDDAWMTNGSYNVNKISAYASVELNLDVKNEAFARLVRTELDQIIADHCRQVIPEDFHRTNNLFRQFRQWISFQTIRLLFFLFTFYFRQEKGAPIGPKKRKAKPVSSPVSGE
jgi:cardiolipin synthase